MFTASGETKEDIGKCVAFVDDYEAYAGGDIIIVSTTDQDSMFLGYALNSPIAKKQKANFGQGDTVVHISAHTLGLVQIPLPPLKEQKRIAEVLSHFDEHIDNLVALLEKRKQVKAATMQALLSGATRLPGFTAPWQRKTLCHLAVNIRTGKLDANAMTDHGEYPFFTCDSNVYKTDTYAFNCEAILISGNGSQIGHTNYYSGKFNAYQRTYVISDFVANVTYLLYYVKCFFRKYLKTETNISSIPFITMPVLKDFPICIPGNEKEQEAIATVLSNMDRGIEALEQKIKKYRQMKEGAMEELLTGKIRLS